MDLEIKSTKEWLALNLVPIIIKLNHVKLGPAQALYHAGYEGLFCKCFLSKIHWRNDFR